MLMSAVIGRKGREGRGPHRIIAAPCHQRRTHLDKLACAAPDDGDALEPDGALDPRTLALVRLAALAAVGGAVPSYGAQAHAAVDACASAAEMVDVLIAVLPVVGIPCVVAAAPKLALALGYDSDDALEQFK